MNQAIEGEVCGTLQDRFQRLYSENLGANRATLAEVVERTGEGLPVEAAEQLDTGLWVAVKGEVVP